MFSFDPTFLQPTTDTATQVPKNKLQNPKNIDYKILDIYNIISQKYNIPNPNFQAKNIIYKILEIKNPRNI